MPSQTDFEKVSTFVIRRIERHYNKTFTTEEIDDYVKSLSRYSQETLIDAMTEVIENETRRPHLAHIVQAAKKASASNDGFSKSETSDKWREERELKGARMRTAAKDYTETFRFQNRDRLNLMPEHKRESLIQCVYHAAYLQAQFIEGEKNCSYQIVTWLHQNEGKPDERLDWWKKMCKENAAAGHINVTVPWLWYEPKQEIAA